MLDPTRTWSLITGRTARLFSKVAVPLTFPPVVCESPQESLLKNFFTTSCYPNWAKCVFHPHQYNVYTPVAVHLPLSCHHWCSWLFVGAIYKGCHSHLFFPNVSNNLYMGVSSFHTTGSKSQSSLIGTYAQTLSSQTTTGLKSSGKLRKKSKQNLKAICYQAETGRKKGYLLLSLPSNRCCKWFISKCVSHRIYNNAESADSEKRWVKNGIF